MAYYTPTSVTWSNTHTFSNGDYQMAMYWLNYKVDNSKRTGIVETAQSLASLIDVRVVHEVGQSRVLIEVLLSDRKDVEWMILKHPSGKCREQYLA